MGDITLRAIETLRAAAAIYAEDTRATGKLLQRHDISTKQHSYREAVTRPRLDQMVQGVTARIAAGEAVALVSDAGTPGISDPGDYLVRQVRAAGFEVVAIPGPSALAALLSVAGQGVQRPLFEGFLPHKKGRQTRLKELGAALQQGVMDGIVFYESPHRLLRLLQELLEWGYPLRVCLGRELTKQFEEVIVGELEVVLSKLQQRTSIQGECVLLITHG
jgi:16S rRNA (cytidine1402-2'-O)-methyltransferase